MMTNVVNDCVCCWFEPDCFVLPLYNDLNKIVTDESERERIQNNNDIHTFTLKLFKNGFQNRL